MTLNQEWFSEIHQDSAYSLRLLEKLHEEQSPFQKIEVYATVGFGHLMVLDGCIMLTDRDNFLYHEMMTHPILFSHPAPGRVVIIGGGDCGSLRETLKHAEVRSAVQIDIDERVTRVAERFFPALCSANADPRAELRFADGIAYLADAAPGSIDVLIIDSTDPVGPAEGLFSDAFYRSCRRALAPNGLLGMQSESPLLHADSVLGPMYARLRAAGFQDLQTLHFPQPCYPSGWWTTTIAAVDGPIQFARATTAEALPFATLYYNAAIHRAASAQPEFLRRKLQPPQ